MQVEETFEIEGAGSFLVRSLSREHKHTLAHTGLMLWEAAPVFARYLALSPTLLNGAPHSPLYLTHHSLDCQHSRASLIIDCSSGVLAWWNSGMVEPFLCQGKVQPSTPVAPPTVSCTFQLWRLQRNPAAQHDLF